MILKALMCFAMQQQQPSTALKPRTALSLSIQRGVKQDIVNSLKRVMNTLFLSSTTSVWMTSTPMGFMFFFLSCKHRSAAANKYEQTDNRIVCKRSIVIYKNLALIKIASEARKF